MLNFISEYVDSKRKTFENYDRQISKERAKLHIKKTKISFKTRKKGQRGKNVKQNSQIHTEASENSSRARTIAPSVYPATRIYSTLTRWRNLKFAYRFSQVTEDMWYIDFYTRKFQKAEIIHLKLMNFVKIKKRYCGKVQLWTKCCKIDVQATGDGEILMIDFVI